MLHDSLSSYQERKAAFDIESAAARNSANALSNARLAVFLTTLAGFLGFVFRDSLIPALLILLAGIAAFAFLMVRHERVLVREKRASRLSGINEAGIRRLQGGWTLFPEDGRAFADDGHPYASDLDLFGPASLFQWMNAAQTRLGREHLRHALADPPRPVGPIRADQGMVRELAPRLEWRQEFQTAGGFGPEPSGGEDPDPLLLWAEDRSEIFPRAGLVAALRFLPILSIGFSLLGYFAFASTPLVVMPFLVQMAIASWNRRRTGMIPEAIGRQGKSLGIYLELVRGIESAGFSGTSLQALAGNLHNPAGTPASEAIRGLQRIAEHMETRLNPILAFLVNTLLLWDIQWLWAFRKWRLANGASLRSWLETIACLESLSSLAIPAWENPDWVFPEIAEGHPLLEARGMGHPLIPKAMRVGNDLRLEKSGEVLIITGSNMSGKSTLMRTVGINLALAFAGAPVCARGFRCAPVEVHTSMRLRDDLEKRISSFYAELLRIKGIVEAARSGKRILFLVDEIFRGTNSQDRHAGAMAVLRRLHALGSAGLVTTHDLELARLEAIDPESFRNFHFQEHYADGEIRFDYKMAEGVAQTKNAMHLLRMVGLGE